MARCIIDLGYCITKRVGVTIGNIEIDTRYPVMIGQRADNFAAIFFLQLKITAGMVVMVMRVDDMGQCPPQSIERFNYRFSIGGINHPDLALTGFLD